MKTLYLDIFSGISGDMFIGALLDLGVSLPELEQELRKLGLEGYHLHVSRSAKCGIAGTKFDVHLDHEDHGHHHDHPHEHAHEAHHHHQHAPTEEGHPHSHKQSHLPHGPHGGPLVALKRGQVELSVFETGVPPRFRLYFADAEGRAAAPPTAGGVTVQTVRPGGKRQKFKFKRQKGYLEATTELPEPHEFNALIEVKSGARKDRQEVAFAEDHDHHHGHHHPPNSQDEPHPQEHAHGRGFCEIRSMIESSSLSNWVKEHAVAVFERIAVAEGRIHGLPRDEVHFHEVGAVDSIVDIVGGCIALDLLGRPRVLAAPVVEGTGWVDCAHGRFPIPAPATLAILGACGVAVTQCEESKELVTPTGAALLAEFAESFAPMSGLVADKIGFGLGTRDNHTRPNVLRAILGDSSQSARKAGHDWQIDTVAVLETNLDDLSPEILGHFIGSALAAGALDAFHTPIQMKKNRPGILLTVLCAQAEADRFTELLLRETSAFGVRRSFTERRKLAREIASVKTKFGEVQVKIGRLDGKVVQVAPEYESCKNVAASSGASLQAVYAAARAAYENKP